MHLMRHIRELQCYLQHHKFNYWPLLRYGAKKVGRPFPFPFLPTCASRVSTATMRMKTSQQVKGKSLEEAQTTPLAVRRTSGGNIRPSRIGWCIGKPPLKCSDGSTTIHSVSKILLLNLPCRWLTL